MADKTVTLNERACRLLDYALCDLAANMDVEAFADIESLDYLEADISDQDMEALGTELHQLAQLITGEPIREMANG